MAAVSILVVVAGVAISVPIQQHILRWRAERLLADIHALQMGKSTWSDAQKLMHRWGAWGSYEGTCTQARCSYQINLPDALTRIRNHWRSECCAWVQRPYLFLGGRDAFAVARVEVINGLVWGKDYVMVTDLSTANHLEASNLSASAITVWRTEDFHVYGQSSHQEYRIGHPGACTGCIYESAHFTPFADPELANLMMDFNFDCLTRRSPCRNQMDIMPVVEKRVQEEEQSAKTAQESSGGCSLPPEFLGRDRENAVIAVITSIDSVQQEPQAQVSYRLIKRLKNAKFWESTDSWKSWDTSGWKSSRKANDVPLAKGRQVILAFPSPYEVDPARWMDLDSCDIIPLTQANLDAFQGGIAQDIFPHDKVGWF